MYLSANVVSVCIGVYLWMNSTITFELNVLNSLFSLMWYFHKVKAPSPNQELNQLLYETFYCDVVYREFGRWKVNSLAVEWRDNSGGLAPPLDPDFMHTIRQLGRRPTLRRITEKIIKKYGTHLLLSATLGGTVKGCSECWFLLDPHYSSIVPWEMS